MIGLIFVVTWRISSPCPFFLYRADSVRDCLLKHSILMALLLARTPEVPGGVALVDCTCKKVLVGGGSSDDPTMLKLGGR